MSLRLRLGLEWLLIGVIASILVVFAFNWKGTDAFDNLLYDRLSPLQATPATDDILLVNIDEPSLSALGQFPWPRDLHAQIIQKLQAGRPRSISLDVLLSEPSDATNDQALANAISGAAPVFLPMHFSTPGSDGRNYDVVLPIEPIRKAAAGVGQVNITFDDDGIVRRAVLCFDPETRGQRWPHLIELVARASMPGLKSSPVYQRTTCGSSVLIPYAQRSSFREISAIDVLQGSLPPDIIKGRDIIIGASAVGLGDNFPVPNGENGLLPGAEIMANMLSAIKADSFIHPAPQYLHLAFALAPLWLLMIGFLLLRPFSALILSIALVISIITISIAGLYVQFWLPPSDALIGILLVYPLWGWRRLQAMSDFMASEIGELEREGEFAALPVRAQLAPDIVGRQSATLAGAIDHMRDLRRLIADTLSDLPDPMFVTDPNDMVTMTNDLMQDRLTKTRISAPISDLLSEIVAPEFRASVDAFLSTQTNAAPASKTLASDAIEQPFVRFAAPNGDSFVMRRAIVRNDKDEVRGYIHYLADVSALSRAEEERERMLQLLSHDMRAPQSAIIASLDGDIDADTKRRIGANARKTMQLAQDFIDIARMNETEFGGEDILVANLIHEVTDNFWPLANERGLSIGINDESNDAFIKAEADSLSRAFANLIDNAIKFAASGTAIDLHLSVDDRHVQIIIRDHGPGIDPSILPHLFGRFVSGAEQYGRNRGIGLGLAFVEAVVRRHHGSIIGENHPDGGAQFIMRLPVSEG
jgi:CHASE2 domain-containing sensor protein/two-component sensor histidine kinase